MFHDKRYPCETHVIISVSGPVVFLAGRIRFFLQVYFSRVGSSSESTHPDPQSWLKPVFRFYLRSGLNKVYKIRIQVYKVRIQVYKVRIQVYKARIQVYKVWIQVYKVRIQVYKIRI